MKRIGFLYDKLLDKDFIRKCIKAASTYKKRRKEVAAVLSDIETYVDHIYEMVKSHNLDLKPTRQRKIREYTKMREITISPFFPNQILDYMLVESLKPLFTRSFYRYSVGNVNGKGIKYGADYLKSKIKQYRYYIKLDIHHFYQSVNTSILMEKLSARIKDKDFLDFTSQIICRFGYLPIGTYYSQWLSNFYLTECDYYIKQKLKIPLYIRYVDDMLLCGNDLLQLQRSQLYISGYLRNNLNLELKFYGTARSVEDNPISFLGFKITPDGSKLRESIYHRIMRTVSRIQTHLSAHLARRLTSLVGWLKQIGGLGYLFYKNHIYNIIKLGYLRRIISNEANRSRTPNPILR